MTSIYKGYDDAYRRGYSAKLPLVREGSSSSEDIPSPDKLGQISFDFTKRGGIIWLMLA